MGFAALVVVQMQLVLLWSSWRTSRCSRKMRAEQRMGFRQAPLQIRLAVAGAPRRWNRRV